MRKIRLNESQFNKMITESVKKVLSELDWKTYANASKKRLQQYRDSGDKKYWDKYMELNDMANQRFDDDYVGDLKYDTMGDKMKGKRSASFDSRFDVGSRDFAYGAIKGRNKGGNEIFSTKKGAFYSNKGYTNPSRFFRDKEVSDAYSKANDELWDYQNGRYEYDGGWKLKGE